MKKQTQQVNTNLTQTRHDVHQHVTDTIIKQLEAGVIPWHKPWTAEENYSLAIPKNFTSSKYYRGINILLLWSSAINNNYSTQEWATFKQWQDKNECIRKGEKGSLIVYYDIFEKKVNGEIEEIPYLKCSYVFNRCQLASFKPEAQRPPKEVWEMLSPVHDLQNFVDKTNAEIVHGGTRACYYPNVDVIRMPEFEAFMGNEDHSAIDGYFSTLVHELTHWTGAKHRLDRPFGKKFGNAKYAQEELTAELGAAFLCAEFDIATLPRGNHASYIAHWLDVLKGNKQCIFTAASAASKAVDYLKSLQVS